MNQELLTSMIDDAIDQVLSENEEFISQSLARNISPDDKGNRYASKIGINAVFAATRLSVHFILSFLVNNGTLSVSEDALRPQLSVLRGGADPEAPEKPTQK